MRISWSIYACSGLVPEVIVTERLAKKIQPIGVRRLRVFEMNVGVSE